jgi:TolB-like protein/tRNA A-37 threonylcarbamoyl transferase component Bud32/Tfp pilus assembly protein PilF
MNTERWKHVEKLFHAALKRSPAEHPAFLDEACVGDERLRGEVESLLSAHGCAGDFLESPTFESEALTGLATLVAGQIFGRYRILGLLGEGGMGEVYLAEDARLGRRVALKLLPSQLEKGQTRIRRFEREARAAAALSHPNVCVVHEVDETADGHHFIAMEHVEGETLRERIARGRLSLDEALDTAMQVASALGAAHEAGIVHRDIKPENIMLRPDGQIKVLDFGLAKLVEGQAAGLDPQATTKRLAKTEPGMIMGTVNYMSPQQVRGSRDVDERADIWSLGVLLYEMLAGRLPFEGATPSHTIVAITDQEPPSISQYVQGVPAALEEVVKRALAKEPAARYQTARELLAELTELRQRIEVGAELGRWELPEMAASESTPGKRRKRTVAITLAAVLVAVAGVTYFYVTRAGASGPSLAILPLVNASADPNMDYLSDGMTESLINSVSQLPQLRVVPRTTVFRYKGRDADPQETGRDLKVSSVLTGKVVQRGDSLEIQVELVNTADGSQLWGQQYNGKQSGLLAVQQDISRRIAERLGLRLTGEEHQQVVKNYTHNADAYRLYLQGRHFWNQRTETGLKRSIDYFQQAIDLDVNYALAWSGLADSYTTLGYLGSLAPRDCFPQAKEAAMRALKLDKMLAEPHTSLAYAKFYYDWDWNGAKSEFKEAIALDPNYATAHHWYSVYLTARERPREALAEIQRAQELDDSLIIATDIGFESFYSGRYNEAIKQLQSVLAMKQDFPLASLWLGRTYQEKKRYEEAVAEYQKAEAILQGFVPAKAAIGNAYGVWGKKAQAQRVLDELDELAKEGSYVTPYGIALVYAGLGEKDKAFAALEEARRHRSHWLVWLKLDRRWVDLHTDPRFAELVQLIGL